MRAFLADSVFALFYSTFFDDMKKIILATLTLWGVLGLASSPQAQMAEPALQALAPVPAPDSQPSTNLEITSTFQNLTQGYGNWRDIALRGSHRLSSTNTLQGELLFADRFREKGTYASLRNTINFDSDWFGSLGIGAGSGAFYLPKYRLEAALNKKWLPSRQLVTSIGTGYDKAPNGQTDKSLSLGAVYYFDSPWIAEGGVRWNRSDPGSVDTRQQFLALTYGRVQSDVFTVRHGWGSEGYLAVSANFQMVNFRSQETSVSWRHWINPRTGWLLTGQQYRNPLYKRSGLGIGFFHEF